jgi:hypothetical protein
MTAAVAHVDDTRRSNARFVAEYGLLLTLAADFAALRS